MPRSRISTAAEQQINIRNVVVATFLEIASLAPDESKLSPVGSLGIIICLNSLRGMAEVKILIEGYTSADSGQGGEEKTCPTITLVRDKDIVMVVDPGVIEGQEMIADALKKEGLTINDVNIVCITHSHIDHYRNIGMFPKAKTLEYFGLWDGGKVQDWKEQFTDDIRILKTPGHNYDAITLFVKTDEGVVAICGDVFWKENQPENDPYASGPEKLKESRKKVLEMADWIIPGHGKMYKTR